MKPGDSCPSIDYPISSKFERTSVSATTAIVIVTVTLDVRARPECRNYEFVVANSTIHERLDDVLELFPTSPISTGHSPGDFDGMLLPAYGLYDLRISFDNGEFLAIWMAVRKFVDHRSCVPEQMTKSSARDCGIISAAVPLYFDTLRREGVVISNTFINIILNASSPCQLDLFGFPKNDDPDSLDQSTQIRISILEEKYFGSRDFDIVKVVHANESKSCKFEAYEKQFITVSCMAPACLKAPSTFLEWCKQGKDCERPHRPIGDDSTVEITNGSLSEFTTVVNMTIRSLESRHKGTYACAPFYEKGTIAWMSFSGVFTIEILDSVAPSFPDITSNNEPESVRLVGDRQRGLTCAAEGHPSPTFKWFKEQSEYHPNASVLSSNHILLVNEPGRYVCIAENTNGTANHTFLVERESSNTNALDIALGSLFGSAFVLFLLTLLLWRVKSKRVDEKFKELAQELRCNAYYEIGVDKSVPLNAQVHVLSYDRKFEIDRREFTIKSKVLGAGEFGIVYRGEQTRRGETSTNGRRTITLVAVKMPKDLSNPQHHRALLDELKIMCNIQPHVNVLFLIGACTDDIEKRQLFVLTEYCQHGSLKDYLVENRAVFEVFDDTPKTVQIFLKFAYQAANGMEHLGGQNIIHRDLALRNLLLTDMHIVKIADFGMSRRQDFVYRKALSPDVPVPIFWMALESLVSELYTQQSDVWSFGIVLWEMFNCGRRPYPDHEPDTAFRSWLSASEHNRMGPPRIVCEEMYALMRDCWKESPDARPSFSQCKRQIGQTLEARSRSMYVSVIQNLSDAWYRMEKAASSRSGGQNTTTLADDHDSDQRANSVTSADQAYQAYVALKTEVDRDRRGESIGSDQEGEPSPYVTKMEIEGIAEGTVETNVAMEVAELETRL